MSPRQPMQNYQDSTSQKGEKGVLGIAQVVVHRPLFQSPVLQRNAEFLPPSTAQHDLIWKQDLRQ
jgi:hypothetical protein